MSSLAGAARPVQIAWSDRAHADPYYSDWLIAQPPPIQPAIAIDLCACGSWRTPWWPCGSSLVGETGVSDALTSDIGWFVEWISGGCNGRLGFNGITRDQYGSPLGGCTVRLFRTSTNELQAIVTSDANGAFLATSPYNDAHFMTVHKAGSPDVAGASIDTIIPG